MNWKPLNTHNVCDIVNRYHCVIYRSRVVSPLLDDFKPTPETKVKNPANVELLLAREDAMYVLQPLADALKAAAVPKGTREKVLKEAAERSLRLSAQDWELLPAVAELQAGRVVAHLV